MCARSIFQCSLCLAAALAVAMKGVQKDARVLEVLLPDSKGMRLERWNFDECTLLELLRFICYRLPAGRPIETADIKVVLPGNSSTSCGRVCGKKCRL